MLEFILTIQKNHLIVISIKRNENHDKEQDFRWNRYYDYVCEVRNKTNLKV